MLGFFFVVERKASLLHCLIMSLSVSLFLNWARFNVSLAPEFKLSVRQFNEWVLLNTPNPSTIDSILIGNRSPGNHDNPFIRLCHVESNGLSRKLLLDQLQDQANTANEKTQVTYNILETIRKLKLKLDDDEEDLADGNN